MQIIPTAPNLQTKMHKYRFVVVNAGSNAEPQTAIAPNPQYLKMLMEANGDQIRILEELEPDNETRNYGKLDVAAAMNASQSQNWAGQGSLAAGTLISNASLSPEQVQALQSIHGGQQADKQAAQPAPQKQQQAPGTPRPPTAPQQPQPAEEVKFFKIGSTECKMEGGKVYQKQWMPLNEEEMMSYRLISDKNNKILPMTGKHLEMQKWVMTQDA